MVSLGQSDGSRLGPSGGGDNHRTQNLLGFYSCSGGNAQVPPPGQGGEVHTGWCINVDRGSLWDSFTLSKTTQLCITSGSSVNYGPSAEMNTLRPHMNVPRKEGEPRNLVVCARENNLT